MARLPVKHKARRTPGLRSQVRREWKVRTIAYFVLVLGALAAVSYTLFFGDTGLVKYIELKHNETRLRNDIVRLEKENKALGDQVYSLKKDPYYIEKYAREEYGLAKPDEFIFQYKKDEH
jgi:cell division protein FtsB